MSKAYFEFFKWHSLRLSHFYYWTFCTVTKIEPCDWSVWLGLRGCNLRRSWCDHIMDWNWGWILSSFHFFRVPSMLCFSGLLFSPAQNASLPFVWPYRWSHGGASPPPLVFKRVFFFFQNSDDFLIYTCASESFAAVFGLVCLFGVSRTNHSR